MKKINESFVCCNCKRTVGLAARTCRNHCPFCLTSLHVDGNIPGDRASDCHGIMDVVDYEIKNSEIRLLFECRKCGKTHRNKRADDDDIDVLLMKVKKK